jgi:ribonuclease HII
MEQNSRESRRLDSSRTQLILKFDGTFRESLDGYLCGIDEAGRGPLAGPVVAAAVIFSDDVFIDGVFDSKMLTARKREELYKEIISSALCYGVGFVDNKEIDELNILQATARAMDIAVSKLKIKPDLILADGNFYVNERISVMNYVRGDSLSFSIAAASIIAKVTRDRMMKSYQRKYPQFSFSHHKGYCTKKHVEEIKQFGFSDIHRRSFKIKKLDYDSPQANW